jgi:nitrite reductase/ring-hydroxylating ferredoxin subunit
MISWVLLSWLVAASITWSSDAFSIKRHSSSQTNTLKVRSKNAFSYSIGKLNVATDDVELKLNTVDLEKKFETKENVMSWTKQWYPLVVDILTDRSKPHAHQLLGNDIVLWHDGTNWNAFEDLCPHRGVPLSQGRVEKTGELLCAYHAWRFDGTGQCTSIPQTIDQAKEVALMSKTCVKSHPVKVEQGLVWVSKPLILLHSSLMLVDATFLGLG